MSSLDGRVSGLSPDAFRALAKVHSQGLSPTDVQTLKNEILKDGRIDDSEHDLLQELTSSDARTIKIEGQKSANFNPTRLTFSPTKGEARVILQALEQQEARSTYFNDSPATDTNWLDDLGFLTDLTGLVDPTPVSDGVSGLISLGKGDIQGFALSLASGIPYLGDLLAKPAKLMKRLLDDYPGLSRCIQNPDDAIRLAKTVLRMGSSVMDQGKLKQTLSAIEKKRPRSPTKMRNSSQRQNPSISQQMGRFASSLPSGGMSPIPQELAMTKDLLMLLAMSGGRGNREQRRFL